jgi:hypothetical protein
MVMSSDIFAQRYVDGRSLLRYVPLFNTMNQKLNPPEPLAKAILSPRQASSEEGRQISGFLCSLRYTLPSSPMASFSQLWHGISLLYTAIFHSNFAQIHIPVSIFFCFKFFLQLS